MRQSIQVSVKGELEANVDSSVKLEKKTTARKYFLALKAAVSSHKVKSERLIFV